MINVLHIRDTGDMLGAESVILELAKHSKALGINSIIGVLEGGSEKLVHLANESDISSFIIPCHGKIDYKTIRFLKKYIVQNNIHIVHSHGYKEDFYVWLSKLTPIIGTNHLWKRTTLALKFYAFLDSLILKRFDKVAAVSKPILQDMIKTGISATKSLVVPNGVDMNRFKINLDLDQIKAMKMSLGIHSNNIVIGMISSLSKEKGHENAISCFVKVVNDYPNIHLLIVGTGEEDSSLHQLAYENNVLDKITFTGRRNDIPEIHQVIDIFLLNSFAEGLPMALLEAMASGKAVIATDVGDVETAVVDNKTGLLISSNDMDELNDALRKLIPDGEKRFRFGQSAQRHISKHFSSVSMTAKYVELYRDMLT